MHTAKIDLTLTPAGRQVAFSKELLEVAHVFRRVGGETGRWLRVVVNYHSPYLDTDVFAPGTVLEYYVQHETQVGAPEARSHTVTTTIGAARQGQSPPSVPDDIPLGRQHEQSRTTQLLAVVAEDSAGRW